MVWLHCGIIFDLLLWIKNMMLASQSASARLGNEYTNINSIGMACAIACVIQFAELQYKIRGNGLLFHGSSDSGYCGNAKS